ncbi:MAG: uracil-xanthine permease [Oscillospiraceae bacterium]|nr:uracil-xanthine permease [Oscillospiraceae bacterium]MBQ6700811.1 uracil-xanthine permease [Oscillospiraceae bacterium]
MKLIYNVEDKPKFSQLIVFAFQQLLAIITATIVVPILVNAYGVVNLEMDPAAALLGAGVGTFVYQFFTKGKSPVFLGSSFTFLPSMYAATVFGYFGIILGAFFAGLVYVVIALIIKAVGSGWLNKLMPTVVIGPTVALIGLCLAGNAVADLTKASATGEAYSLAAIVCGLFTFGVTIWVSAKGKGFAKLIPFIIGILSGYALASVFTLIGSIAGIDALKIVDYTALVNNFSNITLGSFIHMPKFAFVEAFKELTGGNFAMTLADFGTLTLLYAPVALVVFAEHVADHKNISSIIERDLLAEPGLDRTLLGDGVGSMAGAFFGCCPNTTYGESVGCVAITKNASIVTIRTAALLSILLAFFSPFVAFVNTIPSCVLGGICVALYGFIAVSGLKMIQTVDLNKEHNLFVVSSILVLGIGGFMLDFGALQITSIAASLIVGIIVNQLLKEKE